MNVQIIPSFGVLTLVVLLLVSSCQSDPAPTSDAPSVVTSVPDTIKEIVADSNYTAIDFPSKDSLMVHGHWYFNQDTATTILLCHQARFNKYEYDSIADVLWKRGYNCLAIDQRSGGTIGDSNSTWTNKTYQRALLDNKPTTYTDAEQDIQAAIDFLYTKSTQPILLWGSSYSATLALYNGLDNDKVKAVIAFSPGDYLADDSRDFSSILAQETKPFWVTSSKEESLDIAKLLKVTHLDSTHVHFIPQNEGLHGSKALWSRHLENEEYWLSLDEFLNNM